MKSLAELRIQLATGLFEFTRHAFRRAIERNIGEGEIREAGAKAVIIEDYPADKYSPSCLLLGFTLRGRPLHIQASRAANQPRVRIITLYEPEPAQWINFTHRRP
ncbi:MAG: DUF4258 domain-containing protein [Candidatus Contendobacter sp.]